MIKFEIIKSYQELKKMERLIEFSQMVVDGQIIYRFDHIATVAIDSHYYVTVFRRYNSDFNIMVQDYNGDIYLHQDYTVRDSIHTILCLNDSCIYTMNATSYKHNGPIPSLFPDIANMRWTEIHGRYQTVSVNFGGVFYAPSNPYSTSSMMSSTKASTTSSTTSSTMFSEYIKPEMYSNAETNRMSHEEAARTLSSISTPYINDEILNSYLININDSDSDDSYYSNDSNYIYDSDDYTILRNGRKVPKF